MTLRSAVARSLLLTTALLAAAFVAFPVAVLALGIDLDEPTPPATYLAFLCALYAVDIVIAIAYLRLTGRGLDYLDVRVPTLREVAAVALTVVGLFAAAVVLSVAAVSLVLPAPPDTVFTRIELANPVNYLVFVPFALLVNGPVEEILFRGIVQKELTAARGRVVAVVVAAALFSLFHLPAFYLVLLAPNPPLGGLVVGLAVFWIAGALLGTAYAWTGNLTVAALAHGIYNAALGLLFYAAAV